MKILFVAPYAPVPPTFGGALRIYHLLRQVSQRHEVSLAAYGGTKEYEMLRARFGTMLKRICLISPPWPDRFRRAGQLFALSTEHSFFYHLIYSQQMQMLIDSMIDHDHYDIIQTEFSVLGMFNYESTAVKILDAHNVEYDNFLRISERVDSLVKRFHYRREYKKYFREEIASFKKHDAIFVTSPRDKELIERDVPAVPKFVIPNGVDTSYFAPSSAVREPHSIVFTGMMGYVPNYDGILYFLDEIFPLISSRYADAKLYVVGNKPPAALIRRASERVIITNYVEDVRPYMNRSSVYVVPLRMGGGTRLKILEAMSMQLPIVTTSIGCEGITVHDGDHVFVRDEPSAFAEAVMELFSARESVARLVRNSTDLVRASYEWSVIGDEVHSCYASLTGTTSGSIRDGHNGKEHSLDVAEIHEY